MASEHTLRLKTELDISQALQSIDQLNKSTVSTGINAEASNIAKNIKNLNKSLSDGSSTIKSAFNNIKRAGLLAFAGTALANSSSATGRTFGGALQGASLGLATGNLPLAAIGAAFGAIKSKMEEEQQAIQNLITYLDKLSVAASKLTSTIYQNIEPIYTSYKDRQRQLWSLTWSARQAQLQEEFSTRRINDEIPVLLEQNASLAAAITKLRDEKTALLKKDAEDGVVSPIQKERILASINEYDKQLEELAKSTKDLVDEYKEQQKILELAKARTAELEQYAKETAERHQQEAQAYSEMQKSINDAKRKELEEYNKASDERRMFEANEYAAMLKSALLAEIKQLSERSSVLQDILSGISASPVTSLAAAGYYMGENDSAERHLDLMTTLIRDIIAELKSINKATENLENGSIATLG